MPVGATKLSSWDCLVPPVRLHRARHPRRFAMTIKPARTFHLVVRATSDDPIKALRGALKVLGRRFKLKCTTVYEVSAEAEKAQPEAPITSATEGTKS
jgi:hypothetical protein